MSVELILSFLGISLTFFVLWTVMKWLEALHSYVDALKTCHLSLQKEVDTLRAFVVHVPSSSEPKP